MSETSTLIGREALMEELWQTLRPRAFNTQKRAVLHGPAGIGKTELARHFARAHKANDQNSHGFAATTWLDARSETMLQYTLAFNLWKQTGLGRLDISQTERDAKKMIEILEDKESTTWLLILDNVDVNLLASDVFKCLSCVQHGSIILITRKYQSDVFQSLGTVVEVGNLSSEDSLRLIAAMGEIDPGSLDDDGHTILVRIADKMDRLPQNLVLAGSYIAQTGVPPSEYQRLYAEYRLQTHSTNPLATGVALSYKAVESSYPASAKILNLMACYYNDSIWYSIVAGDVAIKVPESSKWFTDITSTEDLFDSAAAPLVRYGFLEAKSARGHVAYSMRPCVQDTLKQNMSKEEWNEMAILAIRSIGHEISSHAPTSKKQHFILPHADAIYDQVAQSTLHLETANIALFMTHIGDLYLHIGAGFLSKAEMMYSVGRRASLKRYGPDNFITFSTVHALGRTYGYQGRYNEAEELLFEALDVLAKIYLVENEFPSMVRDSLGALYRRQGRDQDAEDMFRAALRGYTRVWGPYHAQSLGSIENLVDFYVEGERFDDAISIYKQHLADCRAAFPPEYTAVVDGIWKLTRLYRDLDRGQEEAEALRPEIDFAAFRLAKSHHITYQTICNMGLVYLRQDRFNEAEGAFYEVMLGMEIFLGFIHRLTLQTMVYLAAAHIRMLYLDKAEFELRKVLELLDDMERPDEKLRRHAVRYLDVIQGARDPVCEDSVESSVEEIIEEVQQFHLGYRSSRL
ncbi:P-loop containing nucleoside triphosphate hydrolase protein [Aspergillus insuetus]